MDNISYSNMYDMLKDCVSEVQANYAVDDKRHHLREQSASADVFNESKDFRTSNNAVNSLIKTFGLEEDMPF